MDSLSVLPLGMVMAVKIVICLNTAWNLVNFRSGLIRAMVAKGYEVVAIAPDDKYAEGLTSLGCRFIPMSMDSQGTHPGRDALLLYRLFHLLRTECPDVYLGYTVKPNVYGSIAAYFLGIPVVNNIAGLGAVFGKKGPILYFVKTLYRIALSRSAKIFFQNKDDRDLFIESGLVRPAQTDVLPGSGVDLKKFNVPQPKAENHLSRKFRFLLIARMLWDKGIGEYVEAAKILHQRWPHVECCLLGFLDAKNPGAINRTQMDELVAQGVVYLGSSDNVAIEIANADCIVLPSYYREGTPRVLLEAAAMGRPIITTNAVGCREVVDDGINGYLCKIRDARDLVNKMELMLTLSIEQREAMGLQGRKKMEAEFDERIVIEKYLAVINSIVMR